MPPPSALAIKTGAVARLVKEENSYHREIASSKKSLDALLAQESPDVYEVRQQKKVVEETIVMIPAIRKRLEAALEGLELQIEKSGDTEPEGTREKAKQALEDGKALLAQEIETADA
ncbi:tubulin binding cofactor A [Peziza echinospora]|nr:tubulin binding cofactor A [Peziza echinospora]